MLVADLSRNVIDYEIELGMVQECTDHGYFSHKVMVDYDSLFGA